MEDAAPPARDWSLLPLDVLSSIFIRLGAVDVLTGAGLVCRLWLEAAKLPDVWRVVETENHEMLLPKNLVALRAMAKTAVDRSDGQLRVFVGKHFVTDDLMKSPSLRTLRLVSYNDVFSQQVASAIKESPLLELRSLELGAIDITVGELTAVLDDCPVLEVLRLHNCLDIDDKHTLQEKFARIKNLTVEWDDAYWSRSYSEGSYSDSAPDSEDERADYSI